jgi:hypothetical protein
MTTELDQALWRSDPLGEKDAGSVSAELLGAVAAETIADAVGREAVARRAKRKRRIVAGAAGLVLVPGIAVASGAYLSETGVFGKPGMTENDTSEYIKVCAPDFPAYFATLPTPSVAPPAGLTWQQVEQFVVRKIRTSEGAGCRDGGVVMQVTGLKEEYLLTAWTVYDCRAYQAHQRGDTAAMVTNMHAAGRTMDEIAAAHGFGDDNWKIWRDAENNADATTMAQAWRANTIGAPTPEGRCE